MRSFCACLGLLAACRLLGACTDAAEPDGPEHEPMAPAVTVTASRVSHNASYQVRKESGASAYDPADNITYITYNGPGMDVYVRAYHNGTSTWGPLTLARTWTHYAGGLQWAYHNYGAMVLGPDGKLHVFQADLGHALY